MPKRSRQQLEQEEAAAAATAMSTHQQMHQIAHAFDSFVQALDALVKITPDDDFETPNLPAHIEDRVVVAKVLKRMHRTDQLSWLDQYLQAAGAGSQEASPSPQETDSPQAVVEPKKAKMEDITSQDLAEVARQRLEAVATKEGRARMIKEFEQAYSFDDTLEEDHWPPPAPAINNEQLRQQAFTHRSFATSCAPAQATKSMLTNIHNERLEFLGDSYLNYAMTRLLYVKMPTAREGELSLLRAELIGNETAADFGRMYGFDQMLLLNETAERDGVRKGTKVIADTFEAFLGAVTLDGVDGPARADRWLRLLMGPRIVKHIQENDIELVNPLAKQKIYNHFCKMHPLVLGPDGSRKTPVTILYEWVDGKGGNEGGYVIACQVRIGVPKFNRDGNEVALTPAKEIGRGWGPNKKEAEHRAAMNAVRMLNI